MLRIFHPPNVTCLCDYQVHMNVVDHIFVQFKHQNYVSTVHCRFLLIPLTSNQLSMWLNVCVWRLISPINGKIQYTKRCLVKPTTPSLPLLIHHNHNNLWTVYFLLHQISLSSSLIILSFLLVGCDAWMVTECHFLKPYFYNFSRNWQKFITKIDRGSSSCKVHVDL